MENLDNPVNPGLRPSNFAIIAIALLYLLFLGYFSRQHPFGTFATETDFYHLYAPDASRVVTGQFPLNEFQGPGYPVMLSIVARITGDLFTAGKWISILSAVLCVWMVYVLFKRLFGEWVGLGASLLLLTCIEFPEFSIQATTDIFFLMLCLGTLVIYSGGYFPPFLRVILSAFFTGVAYLTRYNAIFLVVCLVLGLTILDFFTQSWKKRLGFAGLYLGFFLLTASPWLIANYRHSGSAFYNANYLNMATLFYPDLVGGEVTQDGTRKMQEQFHSFGEVIRFDPGQALSRYAGNLWLVIGKSISGALVPQAIGWLGLAGFLLAIWERRSKGVLLLLLCMATYFGLMGLNHWEARYFFFIAACYAGLASYSVFRLFELVSSRFSSRPGPTVVKMALPVAILALVWITGIVATGRSFENFLKSHPNEIPAAAAYLKSLNAAPYSLKILARKPHLPYLADQEWVFFPQVKTPDELKAWLARNRVDYVAIGKRELKSRKELSSLGDPKTAPGWLKPNWRYDDPPFILYRVALGE